MLALDIISLISLVFLLLVAVGLCSDKDLKFVGLSMLLVIAVIATTISLNIAHS